jgi:hypothetical protein
MYNVTCRSVHVTTVAVEKQQVLNIISVSVFLPVIRHNNRVFSAQNYTVICDLSGSTIFFPHDLINGTIFRKKLLNIKCVS